MPIDNIKAFLKLRFNTLLGLVNQNNKDEYHNPLARKMHGLSADRLETWQVFQDLEIAEFSFPIRWRSLGGLGETNMSNRGGFRT